MSKLSKRDREIFCQNAWNLVDDLHVSRLRYLQDFQVPSQNVHAVYGKIAQLMDEGGINFMTVLKLLQRLDCFARDLDRHGGFKEGFSPTDRDLFEFQKAYGDVWRFYQQLGDRCLDIARDLENVARCIRALGVDLPNDLAGPLNIFRSVESFIKTALSDARNEPPATEEGWINKS